ncbi:carbohydrate kinase family protein [Patescibacteria group bacterium]|nr:carbohydrate kinase family protein [Patescibacteria group bacterium]MBP9710524.1 carbohydrate kinase family protein [Patescibacteria group bacterium]
MSILISGSLAYDYILNVPDRFSDHLLPDQLHILSVGFLVERLERGWGGTAGNIAYAMCALGTRPLIVSAVGSDGAPYLERLRGLGLATHSIYEAPSTLTAAAHIITDKANNQITGFFPGPLAEAGRTHVQDLVPTPSLALVSPNPVSVMLKHLREAKELEIRTVFDPGQAITLFSPEELRQGVEDAWCIMANDYEMKLLTDRTGFSIADLLTKVELLVTTLGAEGSLIQTADGQSIRVSACPPQACLDPTGAGDAFRAGFFVGYEQGKDLKTCAQIGAVLATYVVETRGTQAYQFTKEEFCQRYEKEYGEVLILS